MLSEMEIGFLASLLTEALKFFPKIGQNEFLKSLVAFLMVVVGTFFYTGFAGGFAAGANWDVLIEILVYAFASYKMIIKPVAKSVGLRSQG
jgi:hypothetical protein